MKTVVHASSRKQRMLTGILLQHSLDWPPVRFVCQTLDKICQPIQKTGGNYAEQSTDHHI
jgi:hypothetical protein